MKRMVKHLGIWMSLLSSLVCMETEQQEAVQRMNLIVEAFQGVGLQASYVFTNSNEVDVFATVPQNFLKFVKSKKDVPLDESSENWMGNHPPLHHCDFTNTYRWKENDGYQDEHISLGYCGLSAPDIAIRLWRYGHKELNKKQILALPDSAVFHIDIYRMGNKNEDLKRGLENYVTEGMKEGFYVVVSDDIERVDWRENPDILHHFKTKMHHTYMKKLTYEICTK